MVRAMWAPPAARGGQTGGGGDDPTRPSLTGPARVAPPAARGGRAGDGGPYMIDGEARKYMGADYEPEFPVPFEELKSTDKTD